MFHPLTDPNRTRESNEEFLRKTVEVDAAITTGDLFAGGALYPKQMRRFIRFVRAYSVLLDSARFIRMTQKVEDHDKVHIGRPITRFVGVADQHGTNRRAEFDAQAEHNKVTMTALKGRFSWAIETETIQDNIEQSEYENTLMAIFAERAAHDIEHACINSDTALSSGTDAESLLLGGFDGWSKLLEDSHIIDAAGETMNRQLFTIAAKRMPKEFRRNKRMLRFMMSDDLGFDWMDSLQGRATNMGDAAIRGEMVSPMGIPILEVPLLPDRDNIDTGIAAPGFVVGDEFDLFKLPALTANALYEFFINVSDGIANKKGSNLKIEIPAAGDGVALYGTHLARLIQDAIDADVDLVGEITVRATQDGRIMFRATDSGAPGTTGTYSRLVLAAGNSLEDLLPILGITAGNYDGTAAGALPEGGEMWLTSPRNLMWGLLDGLRMYTRFDPDTDQILVVGYYHLATNIENVNMAVKIKNIRSNQYDTI